MDDVGHILYRPVGSHGKVSDLTAEQVPIYLPQALRVRLKEETYSHFTIHNRLVFRDQTRLRTVMPTSGLPGQ